MSDPSLPESTEIDVREVLRSYGWECGADYEHWYLTDARIFNLVNIIERQAVALQEFQERERREGARNV